MDKYVIAPPSGSTQNSVGASDRPWNEGHFDSVKLNGGDLGEYLADWGDIAADAVGAVSAEGVVWIVHKTW